MFLKLSKISSDSSDDQLLDRFIRHDDGRALDVLYRRYTMHIYGACRYYIANDWDAEDAAMEVFELVTKELQKKPKIEKFKDWLFIITRNYCYKKLRKNQRLNELIEEWTQNTNEQFVQNGTENTLYLEKEDRIESLLQAVEGLDSRQQQCLTEFYLNGKSYKAIAEELGWEVAEVRTAIQNGRRNLRIRFGVR